MQISGIISVVPTSCEFVAGAQRNWTLDGSSTEDLAQVLLHELGHVMGLEHTNRTPAVCSNGGHVPGNLANPDGNTGVMRSTKGASLSKFRHWRRDDLDGLDHLWAAYYPTYELTYWSDDAFPAFPDFASGSSIMGMSVTRGGSLADTPPGLPQALVTLDSSRRVMFATLGADDSVAEAPSMVDPGPLGVSAGNPEIALGDDGNGERVFVAWTANEQPDSELMQVRWGLRDLAGGPWALTEGFELLTSRVVAGFDPMTSSWLLGTLSGDGEPLLSVVDYEGGLLLEAAALGGVTAYEIGDPVCDHGSGCTMLFSTSELGGPSLGRIDFAVSSSPASVLVQSTRVFSGQDVYGRTSLAPSSPGLFRGVAGPHRFEVGTVTNTMLDPPNPPTSSKRDWPLGLGSYTDDQATLSHRLALPLKIECGNGILQGSEQCDDANLVPGDGCDDLCIIELDPGGDTDDTDDTDGPQLEGDGCQCGVDDRGSGLGFILMGLGGWSVLTRRRCRTHRRGARHSGEIPLPPTRSV